MITFNLLNDENIQLAVKIAGGSVVAAVLGGIVWRRITTPPGKEYPRDTVIHHRIGRGLQIPCMIPYTMKLSTYLRMTKIPYIDVRDWRRSKKNKLTWIEYNGEEIADSEFCIEYLNEKFNKDLNSNFSLRDRGVGRAFQKMLEENTYWAIVLERWAFDEKERIFKIFQIPFFLKRAVTKQLQGQAYGQGIGRHSKEEVYHIVERDLTALSNCIGNNRFLLGDTPCQQDCAVFGILGCVYWQGFDSRLRDSIKDYTNLCDYLNRMKETFWPDWDECLSRRQTQTATQ